MYKQTTKLIGYASFMAFLLVGVGCDSAQDEPKVRIVSYEEGRSITQNVAGSGWRGQVEESITGGTYVVLVRISGSDNTLKRDSLLLFYEVGSELPVDGAFYHRDTYQEYLMNDGVIEIQDWNIDGVVSGRAVGEARGLQDPLAGAGVVYSTVFWVDLSAQP